MLKSISLLLFITFIIFNSSSFSMEIGNEKFSTSPIKRTSPEERNKTLALYKKKQGSTSYTQREKSSSSASYMEIQSEEKSSTSLIEKEESTLYVKRAFIEGELAYLTPSLVRTIFSSGNPDQKAKWLLPMQNTGVFFTPIYIIENGKETVVKSRKFVAKCSDDCIEFLTSFLKKESSRENIIHGNWSQADYGWIFSFFPPALKEDISEKKEAFKNNFTFFVSEIKKDTILKNEVNFIIGNPDQLTVSQIKKISQLPTFPVENSFSRENIELIKKHNFKLTGLDDNHHLLHFLNDNEIIKGVWLPKKEAWFFSYRHPFNTSGLMFFIEEIK